MIRTIAEGFISLSEICSSRYYLNKQSFISAHLLQILVSLSGGKFGMLRSEFFNM